MKKSEITNPIYMTQEGYNKFMKIIADLKMNLQEVDNDRKEAHLSGPREGIVSAEFEDIERKEAIIVSQLKSLYNQLPNIVIVEKKKIMIL